MVGGLNGRAHAAASVAYIDESGRIVVVTNKYASDALTALTALANPVKDPATGKQLSSAIPPGTKVLGLQVRNNSVTVNFSSAIIGRGLSELRLSTIFEQVRVTLYQFDLGDNIIMQAGGKLLSSYLPPVNQITVAPRPKSDVQSVNQQSSGGALAGHSMTLSPGHGIFWNGSGWYTQRPVYGYPLNEEDFHTLEICQYLESYLKSDGMTVKEVRSMDKNSGNHSTGNPWWKMASPYWLQNQGYPGSVYGSLGTNLGSGESDSGNDIRARPLASNYDGTDIYVSVHTNGYVGDTQNTYPTGTETYYDGSTEHATWAAVSQTLATNISNGVIGSIQSNYDSSWTSHGTAVRNSNGNYGEIRIPTRPAALIELAYHDTCGRDAIYLRDNFFRSVAMWGLYKGICDYFGTTPTWGLYSCEYVSDTIPSTMTAGQKCNVSVTLRNRGVLWTEARQIRLGAVNESTPFTQEGRQYVNGEIAPGDTCTFTFTLTAPSANGTYASNWQMLREGVTWFGPQVTKSIQVVGQDSIVPSVPTGLSAEALGPTQVELVWSPSTDNVAVAGYKVFRNGAQIGSSPSTSYVDTTGTANTLYTYTVAAYDGAGNTSARSAAVQAITHAIVFQDGFTDLSGWYADTVADGSARGLVASSVYNHGTFAGGATALAQIGSLGTQGSFSAKNFGRPFQTGAFNCWYYDTASSGSSRHGIHLRGYNGTTLAFSAYLGPISSTPGSLTTYSAGLYSDSTWTWLAQIKTRSIGWHNLRIVIGKTAIRYYIDGEQLATMQRPADIDSYGIGKVDIGHNYNVCVDGYYDDAEFTSAPPMFPIIGTATAEGDSSIRWSYTDASDNESHFVLHGASGAVLGSADKNSRSILAVGLTPNTNYTCHIHAYNGSVEGPGSSAKSKYTLSAPPNVSCRRSAGKSYATPDFVFTAVGGFGAGHVAYYRYAWDQISTHVWTGTETQWNSGDKALVASGSGGWYLHVKGYNAENVANGSLDIGPFNYLPPTESIGKAKAFTDGTTVTLAGKVVSANFGACFYIEEIDRSSGIRVESTVTGVSSLVNVVGTLSTVNGERRLISATTEIAGTGEVPGAIALTNRAVGGAPLNTYTPGIYGGTGLNNIGLLITVAGRVTAIEPGLCYISDGSTTGGIAVDTSNLTLQIDSSKYMVITGISSTYSSAGKILPLIRVMGDADVASYQLQ